MSASLSARASRWIARPSSAGWMVLLGVLLCAPSLDTGLVADDYIHAIVLRHLPTVAPTHGPLDLFRFADGDPKRGQALLDAGEFPWMASPSVRFSFFRPLSALTHVIDYKLWPDSPGLMHAQSLAWFALVLALAAVFYRRFLGVGLLSGLALLAFALDQAHGPAVGWIANRNAIVALALALPALLFHERARREGDRFAAVLAPLFLAAALFAGESSLAICGYLAAHALHLDRAKWKSRLAALTPYTLVVLAWRALYSHLGYGVSGSGIYIDPAQDPRGFLAVLPVRLPLLLLGQFGVPWSDFATLYPELAPWLLPLMVVVATLALLFIAWAMRPILRSDPTARFFATGMLLAALPICATFPGDRLLLFVGLGAMGLVAQLCVRALSRPARITRVYFILCHFVLAPVLLPLRARSMTTIEALIDLADTTIPRTPALAGKTVILLDPPSDIFGAFVPPMRTVLGVPRPARFRVLASGTAETRVERLDARTLRIAPAHGFLEQASARLLRGPDLPFHAGDVINLAGLTIHVESITPDARPAVIRFAFDVPLDDPSLVWLAWSKVGYAPWRPPALGETAQLPARDLWAAGRYALSRAYEK